MTALSKIAEALEQLAKRGEEPDGVVDPFELRHLARQVRAQDEMQAQGLTE